MGLLNKNNKQPLVMQFYASSVGLTVLVIYEDNIRAHHFDGEDFQLEDINDMIDANKSSSLEGVELYQLLISAHFNIDGELISKAEADYGEVDRDLVLTVLHVLDEYAKAK